MLHLCFGTPTKHYPRRRKRSTGLVCPLKASGLLWRLMLVVGFYVRTAVDELLLGPFHGRPACQTIAFGKGVCGTAAQEQHLLRVEDVNEWPGHIACDSASRSEIVAPIVCNGEVVAIIDIDCAVPNGFDEIDEEGLKGLAKILTNACDWPWTHKS